MTPEPEERVTDRPIATLEGMMVSEDQIAARFLCRETQKRGRHVTREASSAFLRRCKNVIKLLLKILKINCNSDSCSENIET